VEAEASGTSLL